jgi:SpoVK/Ycf46/Vps4 family AAA+-type ATPase
LINVPNAEAIAERSRKPLYAISSGELGTDVVQTDLELRRIFSRAKQWGAILLLDEADVFLAKRSKADLKRNAFVSSK